MSLKSSNFLSNITKLLKTQIYCNSEYS